MVARYSQGCAEEPAKPWPHGLPQGPCQAATTSKEWRCYSASLALNSNQTEWSNAALHPNAYCSGPGKHLAELYSRCRHSTRLKFDDALNATADTPLLFVDTAVLASTSDGLQLQVHPPTHGPLILWPTESWESFAVYGSNSVVQLRPGDANYSKETSVRMYYDCVEIGNETHWGQIGSDRSCVATSADGVTWSKPRLDIVLYQGQPSNIVGNCVSPAVFIDRKPGVPDSQRWKMLCSNTAWAGPDGWHFEPMFGAGHKSIQHKDDTMDIGGYVSSLNRYVIFVRRDIPVPGKTPSVHRRIGRCETDDLSNWEKFAPADGCESVFEPDALDPDMVDIYTSSWTRYAGVSWFFPTFYHQFPNSNLSSPDGFPNDGLLNIRLAVSRSTTNLSYVATGGFGSPGFRAPFVAWGVNTCGEWAVHPSLPGGWCDARDGILAQTSFDTSGGYMVAGSVDSSDGLEVLTYAAGQPFTHGGDIANVTWGNNTGIRLLRSRKHGFVSIDAGRPVVRHLQLRLVSAYRTLVRCVLRKTHRSCHCSVCLQSTPASNAALGHEALACCHRLSESQCDNQHSKPAAAALAATQCQDLQCGLGCRGAAECQYWVRAPRL